MELEIKCHNCKLYPTIDVKDKVGENEILIHCEICNKPSQVNYTIKDGKIITIKVIDGKPLEDSRWVDPFKTNEYADFIKRKENAELNKKKILFEKNGKWFLMVYIEIKDAIKPVFRYWKEHPPLNRKDNHMRNFIKNDWKYIERQAVYLRDVYDGDYESTLQDELNQKIESLKINYLKYYNFDGSLDLEAYNRDKPAQ